MSVDRPTMTCAELREAGIDFLFGELEPPALQRTQQHLEQCPDCTAWIEQLRATRVRLEDYDVPRVAATRAEAIRACAGIPLRQRRFWRRAALVAALCVVGVSMAAWFRIRVELGHGVLQIALRTPFAPDAGDPARTRAAIGSAVGVGAETGTATIVECRCALEELAEYVRFLEQRHDLDLLALARAVDDGRKDSDQRWQRQLLYLRDEARVDQVRTRAALGEMASLVRIGARPFDSSADPAKEDRPRRP